MKQATVKLPSGDFLIAEADNYGNTQSFLFPGSWQLLGADPTALSEEEAGEIVEPLFTKDDIFDKETGYRHELNLDPMPYRNYLWNTELDDGSCYSSFNTAIESLDSLAASLGIEKPFVILKLKTDNNDRQD